MDSEPRRSSSADQCIKGVIGAKRKWHVGASKTGLPSRFLGEPVESGSSQEPKSSCRQSFPVAFAARPSPRGGDAE